MFVAVITLAVALLVGAAIVLGMPFIAEPLLGAIGGEAGPSDAMAEAVYILLIFLPLGLAGWIGARLTGGDALKLGPQRGRAIALGLALGGGGVLLAASHGLAANILGGGLAASFAVPLFIGGTVLVLIQTSAEEIFFRGWLQPVLVSRWGAAAGIGTSALAFAALHLAGGGLAPVSMINLALGGLLFGILAWREGGILAASAAHFAWNWSEAMILGLMPNPGVSSFGTLFDLELAGSGHWGGGDEGLNASIGMTVALGVLLARTLLVRRAPGPPVPAAA